MSEDRWLLLPARADEPDLFRVTDRMGSLPEQLFSSVESARAWITARTGPAAVTQRVARVFVFERGTLTIKRAGYGAANGSAAITFGTANMEVGPGEDGPVGVLKLDHTEVTQLRDWLDHDTQLVEPA